MKGIKVLNQLTKEVIQSNSNLLEKVFSDFNIEIKVIDAKLGPVIIPLRYYLPQELRLIQL